MTVSKRTKFANWLFELRHRLADYPLEEIVTRKDRVYRVDTLNARIPLTLVQTYRQSNLPYPMACAVRRWQETNPEFDYRFFDDEEARQFIVDNYPPEIVAAFDKLRPGAFRADLWRYCYLAANGGVYADIRMEPLMGLRRIIGPGQGAVPTFVGVVDIPKKESGLLYNAFLAGTPGHPFLIAAVERAVSNIVNANFGRFNLDVTGPGCLGYAVNTCLGRPSFTDFEPGEHDANGAPVPSAGPYRMLLHDYDPWHREVISMDGQPCIQTKCIFGSMPKADQHYPDKSYDVLYRNRQVFRESGNGPRAAEARNQKS